MKKETARTTTTAAAATTTKNQRQRQIPDLVVGQYVGAINQRHNVVEVLELV
jgi:hypothetical protein